MIYGYIRVSTGTQTTENQKIQIQNYCKTRKLKRVVWVSETISGTKEPSKRKLGKLIETLTEGDFIICKKHQ